ncbi:MAG: MarR family transcriptional regulator [Hyphomicrobiales bacterium]|nr:MarR family transcriptional regulator [Hyphomicrobiales bacterium]
MAKSKAWCSLGGSAAKVYVELRRRFIGHNNGHIAMGIGDAAKRLALGKATVARALAELEAKGFIVKVRPGQWYGRRATEWAVTDRALNGNPPTNAWRQWNPKPGIFDMPKKRARE